MYNRTLLIILLRTVPFYVLYYSTVEPSVLGIYLLCHPVLCCAVLCCAVLCCAVLCCAVLCCAALCRAVPCRAVPCRAAVLCCAALCYALGTNCRAPSRSAGVMVDFARGSHVLAPGKDSGSVSVHPAPTAPRPRSAEYSGFLSQRRGSGRNERHVTAALHTRASQESGAIADLRGRLCNQALRLGPLPAYDLPRMIRSCVVMPYGSIALVGMYLKVVRFTVD